MLEDRPTTTSSPRLPRQAIAAVAALLAFLIVPRLFLQDSHTLLVSPVDRDALAWIILSGVILSQAIFWSLFGRTVVSGRSKGAAVGLAIVGLLFGAPFAIAAALFSSDVYGIYAFHGASARPQEKLYAIEDVSTTGRGGPSARLNPYGLGRIALPLSQAQYTRYFAALPNGELFCYLVLEQRQDGAIRIIEPDRRTGPAKGLIPCMKDGPGVVMNTSDRSRGG